MHDELQYFFVHISYWLARVVHVSNFRSTHTPVYVSFFNKIHFVYILIWYVIGDQGTVFLYCHCTLSYDGEQFVLAISEELMNWTSCLLPIYHIVTLTFDCSFLRQGETSPEHKLLILNSEFWSWILSFDLEYWVLILNTEFWSWILSFDLEYWVLILNIKFSRSSLSLLFFSRKIGNSTS